MFHDLLELAELTTFANPGPILALQLEKAPNKEKRKNLRQIIMLHSPMTWAHINMLGEFDLSDERMVDSMGLAVPKNPDWKSN